MNTSFPSKGFDDVAHETIKLAASLFSSKAKFAHELGISVQMLNNWLNRDKRVSVEMAPFVVAVCNHPRITLESLRPDYRGWALIATHDAFSTWRHAANLKSMEH